MKLGVSFIFLLLTLTSCLSLINLTKKNNTLDENTLSLSPTTSDDFYEFNNDRFSAYDLSPYEKVWLSSINGLGAQWDDDWYNVTVSPGEERLVVFLNFFDDDGDIDIDVYDSNGFFVASSDSITDNEYIDIVVSIAGIYSLKVYFENAGNEYDLMWDDMSPSLFDDSYEDNDGPGSATYLTPFMWLSSVNDLGIQRDNDWYQVYLNPGEDWLYVELIYSNTQGNIGFEIYDTSNNFLGGSNTIEDNEFFDIQLSSDNFYNIRVYGDSFGNVYDLWWEGHIFTGGTDDWAEDNDNFDNATWIDPNYYGGLKIVGYDEDWFQIYLNYGDRIEVEIFFDHFEGNLELELYDPYYNHRNGSYSSSNYESIKYTSDVSEVWRIRIYQFIDYPEVHYDLNVSVYGGVHEGDDPYEMNNRPDIAYWLSQDEQTWLSDLRGMAVQGDEDWYAIEVTPGFLDLEVKLYFNQSLGDIFMTIFFFEVTGHLVEEATRELIYQILNSSSSLDIKNMTTFKIHDNVSDHGIYLIQIGGAGSGIEYDLWWDDHTTTFDDDSFEENDNQGSATDISAFKVEFIDLQLKNDLPQGEEDKTGDPTNTVDSKLIKRALGLQKDFGVQFDEDFYKLEIDEGFEHLIVFIRYDNAEGRLGLRLYDRHMNLLAENFTNSDNDFIDFVVPSNGTHYIKVFGENTGNTYDLRWTALESEDIGEIPGYDLLIVLGVIIGISTIVIIKKRSKFRQN